MQQKLRSSLESLLDKVRQGRGFQEKGQSWTRKVRSSGRTGGLNFTLLAWLTCRILERVDWDWAAGSVFDGFCDLILVGCRVVR